MTPEIRRRPARRPSGPKPGERLSNTERSSGPGLVGPGLAATGLAGPGVALTRDAGRLEPEVRGGAGRIPDLRDRERAPGAPAIQSRNPPAIREFGRRGSDNRGLEIGRVSVRRVSGGRVSRRRLSRGRRSVTPKPDRSEAGRSKPGLSKPGLSKLGLSKWGWRRRRADSNRRIEVLQTSALATWLRRRPRIPGPRTYAFRELSIREYSIGERPCDRLERDTGFEPATSTLARLHSTTELVPLSPNP